MLTISTLRDVSMVADQSLSSLLFFFLYGTLYLGKFASIVGFVAVPSVDRRNPNKPAALSNPGSGLDPTIVKCTLRVCRPGFYPFGTTVDFFLAT